MNPWERLVDWIDGWWFGVRLWWPWYRYRLGRALEMLMPMRDCGTNQCCVECDRYDNATCPVWPIQIAPPTRDIDHNTQLSLPLYLRVADYYGEMCRLVNENGGGCRSYVGPLDGEDNGKTRDLHEVMAELKQKAKECD